MKVSYRTRAMIGSLVINIIETLILESAKVIVDIISSIIEYIKKTIRKRNKDDRM